MAGEMVRNSGPYCLRVLPQNPPSGDGRYQLGAIQLSLKEFVFSILFRISALLCEPCACGLGQRFVSSFEDRDAGRAAVSAEVNFS